MRVLIVFVIIGCSGVLTTSEEYAARFKVHHQECAAQSKLDSNAIAKLRSGDIDVSNSAVKQHVHCYFKRVPLITDDGKLRVDVIRIKLQEQGVEESEIQNTIQSCENVPHNDVYEYEAKLVNCFKKLVPPNVKVI